MAENLPASAARRIGVFLVFLVVATGCHTSPKTVQIEKPPVHFETIELTNGEAPITANLAYQEGTVARHPVILMSGAILSNQLPSWSTNLVNEGYILASFTADYPLDPDPKR